MFKHTLGFAKLRFFLIIQMRCAYDTAISASKEDIWQRKQEKEYQQPKNLF